MSIRFRSTLAIILLVLFVAGCATVAVTGRKQFTVIPESELTALSYSEYDQLMRESEIETGTERARLVKTVGMRLKTAVDQFSQEEGFYDDIKDFEWEVNLIVDDQMVNAFAMPGGKVAVYTGLLNVAETPAQLAAVMGHEIAHAIAEHGNERMSQQLAAQLGMAGLAIALRDKPQETQMLALAAFGLGAQVGILLPYSRTHESEADEIGLYFMALAGYDPHAAVDLWRNMAAAGGGQPPEFLSTHPSHETRIENLQSWMPKAMEYYRRGQG